MRVTIKDIAKQTGLSVSTVSLVLNKKQHRISTSTRQKVLDAAAALQYRPNQLAVGLITKKTRTIGLIIPDITNMFFAEIAKGAEVECQKRDYSMILCNTNDNPDKDVDYVNVLLDRGVDGVILAMAVNSSSHRAAECFEILQQFEKQVVLVDRSVPEYAKPTVTVDNELGGYLATRHLLELGHRKIGCITGPMGTQSSRQRFFGYIRALQEYAVPFRSELIEEGDYHTSSGYLLGLRLLQQQVTAILCYNDLMAYGVCKAAAEKKISIPKGLSVVGFDNLIFSEITENPLTTVSQPAYRMGVAAVEKIIELINQADASTENCIFQPELIVRRSTRPPPNEP